MTTLMATNPSPRFKRSDRIAWRRVQDEVLIISSDTNRLTVLNGTGGRVWELLEAHETADALATALVQEFEVDAGRASKDVSAFLREMRERDLIVEARS